MDLGFSGHGVLVTGASGGIGSAAARAFAAEGARVAVHFHSNRGAAEELAAEIGGVALGADLRDEAEADALVPHAVEALGRLDHCVANAGVWPSEDVAVADMPLERWRATVDANLTATFLTARGFVRHVRAREEPIGADVPGAAAPVCDEMSPAGEAAPLAGGASPAASPSLVLVASTAGLFGEAGHADYAAAKAAIAYGLALSLKNEVVRGVPLARVNVVAPGWTVTPMAAEALTEETLSQVTATMPLRKVASPEDIARAIVMLASPTAAGHVTGQVVTVAGGMEGRLLNDPSAG